MLRSKKVEDYFEIDISQIQPEREISFDIHLYFPQSAHLIIWRISGELIQKEFLEKYKSRGIGKLWVHRDDQGRFQEYLKGIAEPPPNPNPPTADSAQPGPSPDVTVAPPSEPASAPAPTPALSAAANVAKEEIAKKIVEFAKSEDIPQKEKKAMVAKLARRAVSDVADPTHPEGQKKANAEARKMVKEVLSGTSEKSETPNALDEIWKLTENSPDYEHAANVSTYSVLFAMAFGRIDHSLLRDLALAGLLHDIGLSQVSAQVTMVPWKKRAPDLEKIYENHVQGTLDLIARFAPETSPRVLQIISQHHEKFDGTGYPKKLRGFHINDVTQLLGMADVLDSMSSGQWDGQERALQETFQTLEKLEKTRTFPEYFNPEVFAAVVKWTKSAGAQKASENAHQIVEGRKKDVFSEAKKAS